MFGSGPPNWLLVHARGVGLGRRLSRPTGHDLAAVRGTGAGHPNAGRRHRDGAGGHRRPRLDGAFGNPGDAPVQPGARRPQPAGAGALRRRNLACALGETVFHALADDAATPAEVFRSDLIGLRAGTINLADDVDIADMTDGALAGYGFGRQEVIDTEPGTYPITRLWGQHVWDLTACAGLVWNSRRPQRHRRRLTHPIGPHPSGRASTPTGAEARPRFSTTPGLEQVELP